MENTHTVYLRVEEDEPGRPQDAWCNLCEESCDAVVEIEDGRYACQGCLQERIDAIQEALQTKESAAQALTEIRIREATARGWAAYKLGVSICDNPYPSVSIEYGVWREGWWNASRKKREDRDPPVVGSFKNRPPGSRR